MKKISLLTFLLGSFFLLQAQPYTKHIAPIDNEKWWGCFVGIGNEMPFASNTPLYDLTKVNFNNEASPLLLSSQGRYVWSDEPFRFRLVNDTLVIESDHPHKWQPLGKTFAMPIFMPQKHISRQTEKLRQLSFLKNHNTIHG